LFSPKTKTRDLRLETPGTTEKMNNKDKLSDNCLLTLLPREILRFLANYFLANKDQDKPVFKFSHDWRNFMNTNKGYFGKWKKQSQLISIHFPLAETFYYSWEERHKVVGYIDNPRKQLELCFHYNTFTTDEIKYIDLRAINNVRSISVSNAKVIPFPVDVDELTLLNCLYDKFEFSTYSNVKSLTFQDDYYEDSFDLAALSNLEKGEFYIEECENYDRLSNLQSLNISYCDSITDVSCFANISTLKLTNCANVIDVSPLGKVSDLDLSHCEGISDITALGNVQTLSLHACANIIDVSSLKNVHTLDISFCPQITDISGLTAVVVLDIEGCLNICKVGILNHLKELKMEGCTKLNDLKGFPHLQKLGIDGECLLDLGSFPKAFQVKELSIKMNLFLPIPNESNTSESILSSRYIDLLQKIHKLSFQHCSSLVELPSFTSLRSLTITGCDQLTSLPLLPSLGYLEICSCAKLESLEILGSPDLKYPLYEMRIHCSPSLKTISIQRKISQFRIHCCKRLKKVEIHQPMDLLKIRHCNKLRKIVNKSSIVCVDVAEEGRYYFNEGNEIQCGVQRKQKKNNKADK
jgi:hypothetical protein